ncbi:hypothetical protein AYI70_g2487 [Smittium culicis]|uniref:Uncharacterized protein n=1 Tax=Smittium culicis TaxID=133412 RepID=A0A1R1X6N6_9FUNG|nr:hypothetical protein AYI70_g10410 [Smittium culicis]OMJ23082.1 hypothetical protein AYI70_g2487 [Smittium culicis]
MLASTVKVLLSNITSNVTQTRLGNLYKGLDLSVKPEQVLESEVKPLLNQKTFVLSCLRSQQQNVNEFGLFTGVKRLLFQRIHAETQTMRRTTAKKIVETNSKNS